MLAALVFARRLSDPQALLAAAGAFLAFCMAASAIYLINDLMDADEDRRHPVKCRRPIAAGSLSRPTALGWGGAMAATAFVLAWSIGGPFTGALGTYVVLNVLYSIVLKRVVILDVMIVASGFVIRAVAGALALRVEISHWLVVCTTMVSLFLAFTKRRQELLQLGDGAISHRRGLERYSIPFLDQVIGVATASCVMSYTLYCASPEVVAKFGTDNLKWTLPFVIFGIFRYLYLSHVQQEGADPTTAILSDGPSVANILMWGLVVLVVIYGPR